MTGRSQRLALAIALLGALLLAAQAQSVFAAEPLEERDAGMLWALAAILAFSLVAYLTDRWLGKADDRTDCPTAPHKVSAPDHVHLVAEIGYDLKRHPWRTTGIGISFVLWLLVLSALGADPPQSDYTTTFIMWVVAIALFAVAVVIPQPRPRRDWRMWWAQNGLLVFAISAIVLAAFALRVVNLGALPPTLSGDEGSQGWKP